MPPRGKDIIRQGRKVPRVLDARELGDLMKRFLSEAWTPHGFGKFGQRLELVVAGAREDREAAQASFPRSSTT